MGGENPVNNIALMARFNAWVNRRVYGCVAGLSDADYRKDRKAYFGSIHNTLNHLLVVDRAWTRSSTTISTRCARRARPRTRR